MDVKRGKVKVFWGLGFGVWGLGPKHGLRTPNEGINQRNLKTWADVADKISGQNMLLPYLKIWEWE